MKTKIFISAFVLFFGSLGVASAQARADRTQNYDFWRGQLQSPSIDIKIIALKKLASIRNLEAVNSIIPLLRSNNPEIRFQAARSLGRLASRKGLDALGQQGPSETDVYIKAEINRSIQTLRDYFEKLDAQIEKDEVVQE